MLFEIPGTLSSGSLGTLSSGNLGISEVPANFRIWELRNSLSGVPKKLLVFILGKWGVQTPPLRITEGSDPLTNLNQNLSTVQMYH